MAVQPQRQVCVPPASRLNPGSNKGRALRRPPSCIASPANCSAHQRRPHTEAPPALDGPRT
eukprot:7378162-Alexandrium_andersonii.AAC.1